ncbi:MAG: GNAT family N-acetyltransferase [Silicimonas sp.]|nr:GNAT family N-acetyltransferase [Silicimonas sp.]
MTPPVLTTERLTLRPQEIGDWPAFRDLMAGPRAHHMGGPFGESTAWGMFCSDSAHWDFFGHGGLTVEADGRAIGQVSIIRPPRFPQEELGWLLYDGTEGKGYATEAAAALRDWYYASHPAPVRLVSYVNPDNDASAKVARRLGAVRTDDLPPLDKDDHVYLHSAPEALQ